MRDHWIVTRASLAGGRSPSLGVSKDSGRQKELSPGLAAPKEVEDRVPFDSMTRPDLDAIINAQESSWDPMLPGPRVLHRTVAFQDSNT